MSAEFTNYEATLNLNFRLRDLVVGPIKQQ